MEQDEIDRFGKLIATRAKTRQERVDEMIAACEQCGTMDGFPKRPDCDGCTAGVDDEMLKELQISVEREATLRAGLREWNEFALKANG